MPEIVDAMLAQWRHGEPVTLSDDDKAKLVAMFTEMIEKFDEFVASCAAKPVNAVDPAEIERKRLTNERKRLFDGRQR